MLICLGLFSPVTGYNLGNEMLSSLDSELGARFLFLLFDLFKFIMLDLKLFCNYNLDENHELFFRHTLVWYCLLEALDNNCEEEIEYDEVTNDDVEAEIESREDGRGTGHVAVHMPRPPVKGHGLEN